MIVDQIYQHLNDFVNAFGPILNIVPINLRSLKTFTSYLPIKFEANIIVSDLTQKYYFRITPEDFYINKRNYDFCELTLVSNSQTWIKIFSGKETLMGAYNAGKMKMNNVREQYILKLAFLSGILFSFATKKQRLVRTGKYLKFPLFSKNLFTPLIKISFKLSKIMPEYAFERLMKRISPLLEEE